MLKADTVDGSFVTLTVTLNASLED